MRFTGKSAVLAFQCRSFRSAYLAKGVIKRFGRKFRVEVCQRITHSLFEYDLGVAGTLSTRQTRRSIGPVSQIPAKAMEPGQYGLFDD